MGHKAIASNAQLPSLLAQSKTKGVVGTPRHRRTLWSDTERLEEALDVHWCTSEVTCAATPAASMEQTVVPKRTPIFKRFWKLGVTVLAPVLLSPLYLINTTVSFSFQNLSRLRLHLGDSDRFQSRQKTLRMCVEASSPRGPSFVSCRIKIARFGSGIIFPTRPEQFETLLAMF